MSSAGPLTLFNTVNDSKKGLDLSDYLYARCEDHNGNKGYFCIPFLGHLSTKCPG